MFRSLIFPVIEINCRKYELVLFFKINNVMFTIINKTSHMIIRTVATFTYYIGHTAYVGTYAHLGPVFRDIRKDT